MRLLLISRHRSFLSRPHHALREPKERLVTFKPGLSVRKTMTSFLGLAKPGLLPLLLAAVSGCTNFYGKGIQYEIPHQYAVSDPQFMRSMGPS
jgi:hypothetical protein